MLPRRDASCSGITECKQTNEVWALNPQYVAIRDIKMCGCPANFVHGLAMPRDIVTGVEDSKRQEGIWQFAWYIGLQRIEIESLANNHTGDYGPEALSNMLDLLDYAGIKYFGAGKEIRSAHEPIIFDVRGKRIAVLGFDIFLPRSFEALDDRPGTAWGEPDYISADIKRAKEFYHADIVIAYPHWGWEGEKVASANQVQLARLMIDSGADAVVGGHPRVTQNIENYKDKPIFYSLGNFVFDSFDTVDTTTGWALELTINQDSKIIWQVYEAKLDKNGIPINMGLIHPPVSSLKEN